MDMRGGPMPRYELEHLEPYPHPNIEIFFKDLETPSRRLSSTWSTEESFTKFDMVGFSKITGRKS
jgi:hypothetical protein